jgi:hypothetical protein
MTLAQVFLPAPWQAGRLRHLAFPILRFAAVLALFTAASALLFWPQLGHLSSALLGPPEDNMQDFWNSWYVLQPHPDGLLFTRMIRAPEGTPLTYHSFAWPQVAVVWGLAKLFGAQFPTMVLLQNLTLLASFPLAGTGAFYLCRHLSGSAAGGAVGGLVFAFNPSHVAQAMHHAHVAGIEFLPFFVLCYLIALERRSGIWLAGAVCFYALSALSCWYYLFYVFYFMAFHLLYLRLRHHAWPRGWMLAAPMLCLAGTLALLSPLLAPMIGGGFHDSNYYIGSNMFVADLLGYVAFPPTHLLAPIGSGVYGTLTGNAWEGTVYLGLVNLMVLAAALWQARKGAMNGERRMLFYALGGMLFFAAIASGDALHVGGWVSPIHMPGIVLSKLPFFANVRTPARAIVFVYLFLAVALSVATAMALRARTHSAWHPAWRAGLAAVAVLMLLDFVPARLEMTPASCAPELGPIAADGDKDAGVLDLPSGYREGNAYMMAQACHGHAIAQGETARKMNLSLADRLDTRDFTAQRRQLVHAKVKYIALHRPKGDLFAWQPADGAEAAYRKAYPVLRDGPGMTVLKVY